ncbi:Translation elongation factor P [Campylobacter coli]|nr:Translation elongation factor P [Campylobacter coli]
MASYSMGDLKKGLKIEIDGIPFKIVEYQHVKPGKGPAFVRIKIKSFIDGKVLEKTFHAGDKCEAPNLEEKTMQYLMMMEKIVNLWIQNLMSKLQSVMKM